MLIKPFQSIEYVTSAAMVDNSKDFNSVIYLDSTLTTDSIDYGTFGILTG
jgi:hypothetical protein